MSKAPNETSEGYARKNELFAIREKRPLTDAELKELSELTRVAASHLVYNTVAPAKIVEQRNGYIAFYNGKRFECYAGTLAAAKQQAIAHFKPSKKSAHMVTVMLAEKNGKPVVHSTAAL